MNSNLRGEIQQFLREFDIHGPELAKCDLTGNPDFHLLKQARKFLIRAVNEPDRDWYIRELAEYQASMCNNAEKDGIVVQHFKEPTAITLITNLREPTSTESSL